MPFQIDDYFSPTKKVVEKEEAETSQVNGAKKNEVMVVERKEKDAAAAGMKLQSIIERGNELQESCSLRRQTRLH